ncbi:MAG: hypothetical protein QOK29_2913 [Rhodospirillaceae bacterium]|nr:hypothetical protein [Rhodospirillaceae bacterium]
MRKKEYLTRGRKKGCGVDDVSIGAQKKQPSAERDRRIGLLEAELASVRHAEAALQHKRIETEQALRAAASENAALQDERAVLEKALNDITSGNAVIQNARAALEESLRAATSENAVLKQELLQARNAVEVGARELQRVSRERDALLLSTSWRITRPLREAASALPRSWHVHGRRLARILSAVANPGSWPRRIREWYRRRPYGGTAAVIAHSGLFDAEWYCSEYPDVASSGANPAVDYLMTGAAMGRDPGPEFNTRWYLSRYADVAAAGVNPLLHYIEHGKREGRAPTSAHETSYERWVREYQTLTAADRCDILSHIERLARTPLISVLMPVYEPAADHLREAIASVQSQLYPNWELCIADDASRSPAVRAVLESFRGDERIKIRYRETNGHISAASNSALALATGEFVALMDHDDLLAEQAFYEIAVELDAHPDADLLYSDEDNIDGLGRRENAYFKTDWNPDLFLSQNMVNHLGVYRRSLLHQIGGFREGYEGSQDHDLVLRLSAATTPDHMRHIPAVLYHWRHDPEKPSFSAMSLDRCTAAARRAVADHLAKKPYPACAAEVLPAPRAPLWMRVRYPLPNPAPSVSLVMPIRNGTERQKRFAQRLLSRTDYPTIEVVLVGNGNTEAKTLSPLGWRRRDPRIRIVTVPGDLNHSASINNAVRMARGDIVVLVDGDIDVIEGSWLREMASQALRPEVGAVGAKLIRRDDTIEHAGLVLGRDGPAGRFHDHARRGDLGYFGFLALQRNVSAVSGACLAMRRELYLELGGFDQVNLPVSYNDVDLCLRLRRLGYLIVWTPYAELYHLEPTPRDSHPSPESAARTKQEADYMFRTWGDLLTSDPFYNLNLSLATGSCELSFPPRREKPWRRDAAKARDIELQ